MSRFLSLFSLFVLGFTIGAPSAALAGEAAGQAATAVSAGAIADAPGAAVAETAVELFGAARRSVRTDRNGRFAIESLPAGSYRLSVERDGFATFQRRLTLGESHREEIAVSLEVSGVAEFVETVSKVREDARRLPFLTNEVRGESLRATGAATFEEALVSVPGLQHGTQGNAFTRVATRGLRDTADVLIVLDGVPFRQLNGSADLTMLPIQAMQEIEFVKGPSSSVYGRSAIGGVMQVFTVPTPSSRTAGEFRAGLSSFNTREGSGSAQAPWHGGRASGAFALSRSNGFQERTNRSTNFASLTAEQAVVGRGQVRGQYLFSDVDATRGSIIPLQNGRPMFGTTRRVNFGIPDARFEGRLQLGTSKVDVALDRGLLLSNSLSFSRYNRLSTGGITIVPPPTASNKGWNESTARQDTFVNDAMLRWSAGTTGLSSNLLAGVTVEHGAQDQNSPTFANAPTFRGPDYTNPVPGLTALNDPRGIRGVSVNSAFDQTIVSAYLQERLQHSRLGGVLGLRWDDFDQSLVRSDTAVVSSDSRSKLSPRLGVDVVAVQRAKTELTAFANWVQGFRPQFPALTS